ncbi:MAG: type I-U CRISPR-associated protein Cas7 [Planctomycetes bacterium]|nr:type I-U CRISPR-associated protein Cas7 [Planctomycetota bacterium]
MNESKELTTDERGLLTGFDGWLDDDGPAALVIREPMEPVEGTDGVFFPATFAAEQGNDPDRFRGGYNIDTFPDGTNVCLVDTVGSQANRIEPLFAKSEYVGLVPQISIRISDTKTVNLLEAGHRAGDAIVRCSQLKAELDRAFRSLLNGDAEPLAEIAPTSLVFGVWDSRGTQAKLPRLVSATIRAFNVRRHTRHAQYNPVINFKKEGVLEGLDATDDDLAAKGYVSQPIGRQPGKPDPTHAGVQLMNHEKTPGGIRRDAILSLSALRRLTALNEDGTLDPTRTKTLRRYVLGLGLIALTATQDSYLRQGCNLVPSDEGRLRTFNLVYACGKRVPVFAVQEEADEYATSHPDNPGPTVLNPTTVKQFATLAARQFGIDPTRDIAKKAPPDREVPFDRDLAKRDIKGDADKFKGEVISRDVSGNKFMLKVGKRNDQKDVEILTNENTTFIKGKQKSTFDVVVLEHAKLDVEATDGIAVKVIGK